MDVSGTIGAVLNQKSRDIYSVSPDATVFEAVQLMDAKNVGALLVMDGPRFIFLNFVSSSRERIEQAKADWKAGRFAKIPGDEHEFIPLPEIRGRLPATARVSEGSTTS